MGRRSITLSIPMSMSLLSPGGRSVARAAEAMMAEPEGIPVHVFGEDPGDHPLQKTEKLLWLMRRGEHQAALALAATFKMGLTQEQKGDIKRAHEVNCTTKAAFYRQLGKEPLELYKKGIAVLFDVWGHRL